MNEFLTQFLPFAERNPVLTVILMFIVFGALAHVLHGLGRIGQRKCHCAKVKADE